MTTPATDLDRHADFYARLAGFVTGLIGGLCAGIALGFVAVSILELGR